MFSQAGATPIDIAYTLGFDGVGVIEVLRQIYGLYKGIENKIEFQSYVDHIDEDILLMLSSNLLILSDITKTHRLSSHHSDHRIRIILKLDY